MIKIFREKTRKEIQARRKLSNGVGVSTEAWNGTIASETDPR